MQTQVSFKQGLSAVVIAVTCVLPRGARADEVNDIPLAKCTSQQVVMTIHFAALKRETKPSDIVIQNAQWMGNVAKKYHGIAKPSHPLSEYMTVDESAEFAQRRAQNLTISYSQLAESRLQRDMTQLSKMQELAELGWTKGKSLTSESDPDLRQYVYMYGVQKLFPDTEHPTSKNTQECSLDLAFERDAAAAFEQFKAKIQSSPEVSELFALRKKYDIPDGADFNPEAMTPQDRVRAPVLKAAFVKVLGAQQEYQANINALRYFADVMLMKYQWQREEILELGAAAGTAVYDKADAERYTRLSPQMQKVVNFWQNLDNEFPAQATKNALSIIDKIKETGSAVK